MASAGPEVKGELDREHSNRAETQTPGVLTFDENAFSTKPLTNRAQLS
jgi:hypothetical protein